VDEYKATMETQFAAKEQAQFYNIATRRATVFNHTAASIDVTAPDRSAETNGNTSKAIGPAKMLQVSAGDRVQLEVFARYQTGTGGNNALISNLASAVTGSFLLNAGEAAHTAITNSVPTQAATTSQTSGVPKSYLFYILFNSSYVYQQFGYVLVNSTAQAGHQQMYLDITVPTGGYLYTYVANESNVSAGTSVYFDDFTIVHTRNTPTLQVLQTSDYYPFGLPFNSYSRENTMPQDYKFNGKEEQTELNLGWLDFGARMYDPAIGRWMVVDPLAEKARRWSPYVFGYDNPIRFIDPDGMEATDPQQKDPKEKSAQDLKKAQEGKTVQDRVKNVDGSLKKGDYIKSGTVKELANIPANKTKGEKEGTDLQRKLVDQIDKIEKTDKGYVIKLKDGAESIKGSVPLVGKDGEVKMNLDLKIENNATVNLTNNEDGSTSVDFSGIKAGKGFVKVGLPTVTIKGDEGTIMGFTVPLTK